MITSNKLFEIFQCNSIEIKKLYEACKIGKADKNELLRVNNLLYEIQLAKQVKK